MTYLVGAELSDRPAGERFRALVNRPQILGIPGSHNGQAALQAKDAGFEALYLSGAAMTASMGLPDLGMITVDEVSFFVRQVARASGLPVLVDGDTGIRGSARVAGTLEILEVGWFPAGNLPPDTDPSVRARIADWLDRPEGGPVGDETW